MYDTYYEEDIRNALKAAYFANRQADYEAAHDNPEYFTGFRDGLATVAIAFGLDPKEILEGEDVSNWVHNNQEQFQVRLLAEGDSGVGPAGSG